MRIAIVGSGISGLASAWLLRRLHDVHLFEERPRLGGHTHTVELDTPTGAIHLDTGFIVFNERTYPLLTRLFNRLSVATQASDMSFSISCRKPDFEYGTVGKRGLLAQPANAFRPSFWRFVREILRFGSHARELLRGTPDPQASVGDFLRAGRYSDDFARYYLLPMVAAIWSSGRQQVLGFPRDTLLTFFSNHGLLDVTGHPQWRTVTGGSRSYVTELTRPLTERIHLGNGVRSIDRSADGVRLHLADGSAADFDRVVVAAHADQALGLLAQPTAAERELLGAWQYSRNDTWLHSDTSFMPRRRAAWASWNYLLEDGKAPEPQVSVSYHLNRLQQLETTTPYIVTLNPPAAPAPNLVHRRMTYLHPVYTRDSVAAQPELIQLGGENRTHFCGAYLRNGFHEDGLWSAVRVARQLGVDFP